jgi:hypothetical protein
VQRANFRFIALDKKKICAIVILGLNLARLLASAWISCQPLFIGGLMEIKVTCRGADLLPLDAIEEFQGGLKKRTKREIDLITKSIKKYGFSFPFFIWVNNGHNYCLDGHGRIQALEEMRNQGIELPLFPVVYIDAKDEEEAKQKLLRLNSQYGAISYDSLMEFTSDIVVDFGDIIIPSGELNITDFDSKFTPELNPEIGNTEYSQKDVDSAREKLETKYSKDNEPKKVTLYCPHCFKEFYMGIEDLEIMIIEAKNNE